ncbi:hypothetical protein KUTeg_002969 [Tegillarca granosa]|uniref:GATOR complex protein NPRL3 n=1 Tax=Tegillarca granosa TaxID=220873 RepID=A0ABQ9FQ88_TEGGR|nr:hypothetical protein KUTeg_002969 [Tegillarca granosa]
MADGIVDPISVMLVTSGTRGERLLFQYPFCTENSDIDQHKEETRWRNPYGIKLLTEDTAHNFKHTSNVSNNVLSGFSPEVLANLLTVKSDLCSQKFDIKIDNVRFVGYPMTLDPCTSTKQSTGKASHIIISFIIVFALKSNVSPSVVGCYTDLAKQLTVAVHHEERKRQYLSSQAKIMLSVHDEVAAMPEDSLQSPYSMILSKSPLAIDLKHVYDRPYHGILFLEDKQLLQESLPVDCTPALSRLISVASPLRSLQFLALEADLSLSQVFQLVSHLVYWAKATIIYPLCETNVYVLSPQSNTLLNSSQSEEFVRQFPGYSLALQLAEFSYPQQLRETRDLLDHPKQQDLKLKMVVWMLQNRLIMQLHNYVFFVPSVPRRKKKLSEQVQIGMPVVPEEAGILNDVMDIQKASSLSDAASVNSDESLSIGISQFSKSPSSEIASDSSLVSEEVKGHWSQHDGLLAHLTKEERDCVFNLPAAKNMDDLKLFGRLCPYFNGRHHIEEIMYYENLHRSQLVTVIDKFREVLQICQYQDPATVLNTG